MEKLDSRSVPPSGVRTTNWDRMVYSFKTKMPRQKPKPKQKAGVVIIVKDATLTEKPTNQSPRAEVG